LFIAVNILYSTFADSRFGHTKISARPATAAAFGRSGMPLTSTDSGSVARSSDSGPHTTASGQSRWASSNPIFVEGNDFISFSLADRIATRGRAIPSPRHIHCVGHRHSFQRTLS
jgi:hypothetical protein